ncbi:MAG: sensor domain-containing diguanylate cyclase [Candidatus Omnitrophica bacterium]|nr:sensor domain-containing diguanylate cyclase [Candidatus Omnitrophota bacterium]
MIPILKRRLSKYYFFFVASLLVPLVGFFIYASQYETKFFLFLALAFAVNIVILLGLYRRLKRKRSEVDLQKEEFFEKANLMKADLEKEWQAIGAFRQKIIAYSQLKGLVERLSACLSVEDTAHTLCQEAAGLFSHGDSTIILYLFDQQTGELSIAAAERNQRAVNIKSKHGDMFDRWVMKTLQPLHLDDARHDFRFDADKVEGEDARQIRSLLSVPLLVHNKPVGILRMDSPVPGRFAKEDLRFLKAIGDVAAVTIENAQLYDKVEDLAIRDSLTGLYLRRYMLDRLAEELNRHLRRDQEMSFIMFDLDYFKRYNDRFGHTAGDIVLKYVSGLLQTHFGDPGGIICRYGGEEFCVVLPECSRKDAVARAQEFVQLVDKEDIMLRRERTHITVSIGVASFPRDAKLKEELIQKADEALYEAKKAGRNRVCSA